MHETLTQRTRRLLERARWKDSDWDKPTPEDVLEELAHSGGTHIVHFSDVGPGSEVETPAETPEDAGVFVDTTAAPAGGYKVGINPGTPYDTPVGVYGYPLNADTWSDWFSSDNRPPFAADRPWMYVLKIDRSGTVSIAPDGSATPWSARRSEQVIERIVDERRATVEAALQSETGESLPVGDVTFGDVAATDFYREAVEGAKLDTPFVEFWNVTRTIAHEGGDGAPTWTSLLIEQADITSIVDHGSTTLHDNEPRQAVALDPSAYETAAAVENVWDWRQRQRAATPGEIVYQAFEAEGITDLFDVVDLRLSTDRNGHVQYPDEARETVEAIAERLARSSKLRQVIKMAHEDGYDDTITVKRGASGVRLEDIRLDGREVPPELGLEAEVRHSTFYDCDFDARLVGAIQDSRGRWLYNDYNLERIEFPSWGLDEADREALRTYWRTYDVDSLDDDTRDRAERLLADFKMVSDDAYIGSDCVAADVDFS